MMSYKDYLGTVSYSADDEVFYGELAFIRDLVSYEGHDVMSLKQAFEAAVDDYLELCHSQGRQANQPFKGSFSVRTGSELHREVALYAKEHNTSLNTVVIEALKHYLAQAG
jgi:predicted HicB family RNase H-like nuclease